MIFNPFRRPQREVQSIASLYGTIVAQARLPSFYHGYGVPDTVDGRFEIVVLHTVIVLHRLKTGSLRDLGQGIFDGFCSDMDANLRELGVGDLAVPRKMRRLGEAFYGRQSVYEDALAASDQNLLITALARNVFGARDSAANAERLGDYVRETVYRLAAQDDAELHQGNIGFPSPERVPAAKRAKEQ